MQLFERIAKELKLAPPQVGAVADFLDQGATIPFIARYRKEAHGSLDEVAITAVRDDRLAQLRELDARRQAILTFLAERELLTDDLRVRVEAAENLALLEDVYLPFRPKRRTRAAAACEKGLRSLSLELLPQRPDYSTKDAVLAYVDAENGVADAQAALTGARGIIAETVNEDPAARATMRDWFARKAVAASSWSRARSNRARNSATISTGGNLRQKPPDTVCWPCCAAKRKGY